MPVPGPIVDTGILTVSVVNTVVEFTNGAGVASEEDETPVPVAVPVPVPVADPVPNPLDGEGTV